MLYGDIRLPQRFWDKVYPEPNTACWLWGASLTVHGGYGQFSWNSSPRGAHIIAYEALVGEVQAGLQLDHTCRTRPCCNPAHLEPVTQRENLRRGGAAIKECKNKHAFTLENTYVNKRGTRECKACHRERQRKQRKTTSRKDWTTAFDTK